VLGSGTLASTDCPYRARQMTSRSGGLRHYDRASASRIRHPMGTRRSPCSVWYSRASRTTKTGARTAVLRALAVGESW